MDIMDKLKEIDNLYIKGLLTYTEALTQMEAAINEVFPYLIQYREKGLKKTWHYYTSDTYTLKEAQVFLSTHNADNINLEFRAVRVS